MPMSARAIDERMSAFMEACRERAVKVTHQRIEIYREVASSQTHPDVNTIFRGVRKRIPTIALDTVYRNLKFLSDHGLITTMGLSREHLRVDSNLRPHHHFVCIKCGAILDFDSDDLRDLAIPREARACGRPLSIQLEIRGVCGQCRRRPGS